MDARTWLAAGVTLFFWSSAFAVIRLGLRFWGPGELALARFLVASLALAFLLVARRQRLRRPARGDVPRFLALGLTGIALYHTCLNWGEMTVPAGTASLIIATAPALTALLAHRWLGERLAGRGWAGLILSFTGVALISVAAGQGTRGGAEVPVHPAAGWAVHLSPAAGAVLGPLAVWMAALATSVFFVLQKPLHGRYGSLELTAYYTWAGTLPMLAFAPALWQHAGSAPPAAWLAVLYLGLFPSAIAYVAWSAALARAPAGRVASLLNLNPPLALVIAWLALDEIPGPAELAGGLLAIAGVALVQQGGRPAVQAPAAAQPGGGAGGTAGPRGRSPAPAPAKPGRGGRPPAGQAAGPDRTGRPAP